MKNLNLLVVEGNLQKENANFKESGIQTHTESLKEIGLWVDNNENPRVFSNDGNWYKCVINLFSMFVKCNSQGDTISYFVFF